MTEYKITPEFGSILIIVPHQDDEILMTAGILHAAAGCGLKADVVMATNGDYACLDFSKGRKRLRESLNGLSVLGISQERFIPLGYADTGMEKEVSFLTALYHETDENKIFPSSCSKETYSLPEKPDYHTTTYREPAKYTRKNFFNDLKEVILQTKPDHIFTTSKYDLHGDHEALYLFVTDILRELSANGYTPKLYTGLVHSIAGDDFWPLRDGRTYTCPPDFHIQSELVWESRISFPLPSDMLGENALKQKALSQHKEALEPNAVEFLTSFYKDEEIFWEISYR